MNIETLNTLNNYLSLNHTKTERAEIMFLLQEVEKTKEWVDIRSRLIAPLFDIDPSAIYRNFAKLRDKNEVILSKITLRHTAYYVGLPRIYSIKSNIKKGILGIEMTKQVDEYLDKINTITLNILETSTYISEISNKNK